MLYKKFFKRVIDFLLALVALSILSPLLVVCMIILLCTGEHEVFYFQQRIGRGGRPFRIWKFATMLKNSPDIGTGTITTRNDPRVLPFGAFLRKSKINELPQIINVLSGSMSVTGPRPLVEKHCDISTTYRTNIPTGRCFCCGANGGAAVRFPRVTSFVSAPVSLLIITNSSPGNTP